MSVSDDIGNLFRQFGGNADTYQEVARDDEARMARARWPLLAALDVDGHKGVRPAGATVQIKAAQPAANPANPARPASKLPLFARGHRHATAPVPSAAAPARVVATPRFAPAPAEPEVKGDLSRLFRRLEGSHEPEPASGKPAAVNVPGRTPLDLPGKPS